MNRKAAALVAASAAALAVTVVPLPTLHAQPAATTAAAPDQRQAIARGFIDMINDGSPAAVEKFESAHRSAARLTETPIPERIKRVARMKEQFGSLRVEDSVTADNTGVSLVARSARGALVAMEFKFDSDGKLDGVILSVGGEEVRPKALTAEMRKSTVLAACKALEEGYVFPEVAAKMAEVARGNLEAGRYDSITTEGQLARRLTDDFRSVSKDLHLGVRIAPGDAGGHGNDEAEIDGPSAEADRQMAKDNYAFRKVEMLEGNIGYVRFDLFINAQGARDTAAAAMAFLRNADAVIFDMRYNGGGSPEFIQFLTTYLVDEKTHLNDMVDRNGAVVEEYWTLPEVPGRRLGSKVPVYVLTSRSTFSGAEEFTYNLKNLKRATVIGETTGGGAHPVRGERLNDRFVIGVPFMRARNPITQTNWEGTGVEPDIKVPAEEALDRAIAEARKNAR